MPYSRITRTAYGADAIRYARGHGRGHNGQRSRNLYSAGVNMLPDGTVAFEKQMRPLWERMDARHKIQVDRCVVSFSPNELDPDREADQLTALEICNLGRKRQVMMKWSDICRSTALGTEKRVRGYPPTRFSVWHQVPLCGVS